MQKKSYDEESNAHFYLPDLCTIPAQVFLLLIAGLLGLMLTAVHYGVYPFPWDDFGLVSFFVLWVFLPSSMLLCLVRPYLQALSLSTGVVVCYAIVLIVTGLVSVTGQQLMMQLSGTLLPAAEHEFLSSLFAHLLVSAILTGIGLRYFYLQHQLHLRQQSELRSQIQALQSRIRPHFLFNSMNIIASLIETQPAVAEQAVEDLSILFRASLADAGNKVTVQEELDLVRHYVHIEQLRLGERLRVDWQLGEIDDDALIPHLSVQPLMENAVYHGIQPLPAGGCVTLRVAQRAGRLEVEISNPCPLTPQTSIKGNKLALENLERRLRMTYGSQASFRASGGHGIFTVSFSYPLDKATKLGASGHTR